MFKDKINPNNENKILESEFFFKGGDNSNNIQYDKNNSNVIKYGNKFIYEYQNITKIRFLY